MGRKILTRLLGCGSTGGQDLWQGDEVNWQEGVLNRDFRGDVCDNGPGDTVLDEHSRSFSLREQTHNRVWQVLRVDCHELILQLWRDNDFGITVKILNVDLDVVEESLDAAGNSVVALWLVEMLLPVAGNPNSCD